MNDIDFSGIAHQSGKSIDDDWEPPQHKFFGKKLADGKTEKEPVYSYQAFPAFVYSLVNGRVTAKLVNSKDELDALGEGWTNSPADHGLITCPSFEQINAKPEVKDDALEALKAEAVALGIDVKGTWGVKKLTEAIEAKKAE